MTGISYEYSLFVTDEGELSTGWSAGQGETLENSVDWLTAVFAVEILAALKENPNRIISFVVVTKGRET